MTEPLALREAHKRLDDFTKESQLIQDHREAMERRDCEDFLQLGIEAFDWLIRADRNTRMAIAEASAEYDPEVDHAIEQLFRGWLSPCDRADVWIRQMQARSFQIENLERFKECEAEVRAIVKHMNHDHLTAPMIELRDAAIEEHRNGETAEFV